MLLIAKEAGKPLPDARVEAIRAPESIKQAARVLTHSKGTEVPLDYLNGSATMTGFTVIEPIGLVIAIGAFNHSLNLVAHQIAPAIAAGCPVIVKPASDTPLSCIRLVEHFRKASLPEKYCRVTPPPTGAG